MSSRRVIAIRSIYGTMAGTLMLVGAVACLAADQPTTLRPSPGAFPAISAPATVADASSCVSNCQARHDQCRVATKDAPGCDAERQRCLQSCLAGKRR